MQRWSLISDSAHTYACPIEKVDEAYKVFEAIEEYWEPGADTDNLVLPEEPDYVIRIDGTFTFSDPQVS
jgi:hypothetical protein